MFAIMKTMCPRGYDHSCFVASHAFGHMMYGCHIAILVITGPGEHIVFMIAYKLRSSWLCQI